MFDPRTARGLARYLFERHFLIEDTDKRLRQLLFLDLLEQGIYIAERGFMALSLVVTDADCDRLVKAVEGYITRRRELLV